MCDALKTALERAGLCLVDVRTNPNTLLLPSHISAREDRGFALAAARTVLDGGLDKMVDLASANLRNIVQL